MFAVPPPIQLSGTTLVPALLLLASPNALAQLPVATMIGPAPGAEAGICHGLGDIDGDGVEDFSTTAVSFGAGEVTIRSGIDCRILGTFSGPDPGSAFGLSVSSGFGVDGVSGPVVAIGAPAADGPAGVDAGRVYVYEFTGTGWNLLHVAHGESAGDGFGAVASFVGDVDGDGSPDIGIGAPLVDGPAGADSGRVYVIGSTGGTFAAVGAPIDSLFAGGEFGAAVVGLGDVGGSPGGEVAVGAPEVGRAFVFTLVPAGWASVQNLAGAPTSLFGQSLAVVDANSDGTLDLFVGAPEDDSNGTDAGSVFGFDGATGAPLYTASGSGTLGHYYGYALDDLDDIDADGVRELVVGIPEASPMNTGAVRVLSGATGDTMFTTFGELDSGLGQRVAGLADITGDGRPDILAGALEERYVPPFPPGYVRLYTTAVPLGANYCQPAVANSTGEPSTIHLLGSSTIAAGDLTLTTTGLPASSFAYYLVSLTQGSVVNAGGSQGTLCLGGSIGRYVGAGQIQNSGHCRFVSLTLDLTQVPQPTGFVAAMPGETWFFQLWHRDSVGGSPTSNFSNGVGVTFQ